MQYDIAVIGGGPAGCAAAITAASKGAKVILFEGHGYSPRLRSVEKISDYLGLPEMPGDKLMDIFVDQLNKTNTKIVNRKIVYMKELDEGFQMMTSKFSYEAKTVIICTGVSRSVTYRGERDFLGQGVSYCPEKDVDQYIGKDIAVIATVPDALDDIELLAEKCKHVYYLPRFKNYPIPKAKNVTIDLDYPDEITGTTSVTGVRTIKTFYNVQACFILRATDPPNSFLPGLDLAGRHVFVDDQAQTNIEGIFAGGDCTGKPYQVNRAAGQGQKAAISALRYLKFPLDLPEQKAPKNNYR